MSWALDTTSHSYKVARSAGLDETLNLPKACADFYWLERAAADGMPGASERMVETETYIAEQFAIYLDMACGGELRLLPIQGSSGYGDDDYQCEGRYCGQDGETCWSCSGFFHFQCGTCHNLECRASKEGWQHESEFEAVAALFKCLNKNGSYVESWSCDCNERDITAAWQYDIRPELQEFFDTMEYDGSPIGRSAGWKNWLKFRETYGVEAVKWMAEALDNGHWSSACGGPKWAAAAKLLYDYLTGAISPRVMVNMAWSMEHNGGCIFNKVYAVDGEYSAYGKTDASLRDVLVEQARNNYDYLKHNLSDKVKKFADYQSYIGKTAIGKRMQAEALRDKLEPYLYYREQAAIARFGE